MAPIQTRSSISPDEFIENTQGRGHAVPIEKRVHLWETWILSLTTAYDIRGRCRRQKLFWYTTAFFNYYYVGLIQLICVKLFWHQTRKSSV